MEKLLPRNEGSADRVIRGVVGLALLSMVFVGPQTLWGLVGLVFIGTAAVGSCPVYTLLGINSCGIPRAK